MKKWATIAVTFAAGLAAAVAAVYGFHCDGTDVFQFYKESMRGSLFTGFLSIGGFMLSLKTFVVVKMKEGLYASKSYMQQHADMKALGSSDTLHAPLKRLSDLLFVSILAALVTSGLQMTLGLRPAWWTAAICLGFAGGTLSLLLFALIQIKGNLDMWFECLDRDKVPPA